MHPFKTLISEAEIKKRVQEMGAEISKYYQGKQTKRLIVIGVLKGSFIFLADLVRSLKLECEIEFVEVSSYGAGTISSGEIQLLRDIAVPLEDQDVLVVEDIIDTGRTIYYLLEHLRKSHRPHSTAVAALLYKPSRSVNQIKPDFLGFTIDDQFVIGYGLDFNNRFREIPEIAIYEESRIKK
jgi:hypoxanthine phosphoribosyltransferase